MFNSASPFGRGVGKADGEGFTPAGATRKKLGKNFVIATLNVMDKAKI